MPVKRISEEVKLNAMVVNDALVRSFQNISGFNIGVDYIRDAANSFGLASTVSGSNDVRLWAGSSFASRDTAPFRVYENGATFTDSLTASAGSGGNINGFTIGATTAKGGKFTTLEATSTVKFGTHSAIGIETVTGFITITDAGGASRKIAVVS